MYISCESLSYTAYPPVESSSQRNPLTSEQELHLHAVDGVVAASASYIHGPIASATQVSIIFDGAPNTRRTNFISVHGLITTVRLQKPILLNSNILVCASVDKVLDDIVASEEARDVQRRPLHACPRIIRDK